MGLFSATYETVVGTSVARAIPDATLPDSIRSGGIRSLIRGSDLPETMTDELYGSLALKANRMYEYGKTKYTHGLPSGQFASAMDGQAAVTAVLESQGATGVVIEYSHFRSPNLQHIGWLRLWYSHGYTQSNNVLNTLTTSIGHTVYLDNMTVVLPASTYSSYTSSALEQWGRPATAGYSPSRKSTAAFNPYTKHTPIAKDSSTSVPYIKVDYCWETPSSSPPIDGFTFPPDIHTGTFTISVDGFDDGADYYQVCYHDGSSIKYWMYQGGVGTYPTLDAVFNPPPAVAGGSFFPFAYFRYNKVSEISDKTTPSYKTNKKLVSYLGMDYDSVAEAINTSPNIADVEQVMLIMAVPANSTNPLELRYLFTFFDNLYASNLNQYSSPPELNLAQMQVGNLDISRTSILIQDKRFKMALSNAGITKRKRAGTVGPVGTHSFVLQETTIERVITNKDTGGSETFNVPYKVHVYRSQISSVMYEEIQVVDLQMIYHIFAQYTYIGGAGSTALLIPIDNAVSQTYSLPDREELFGRSLHYVFNSRLVVKLAWYQQEWFQGIVFIAGAVMAVSSLGTALGPLATAISMGGSVLITFEILVLIGEFLFNLLVLDVMKRVVKIIGVDAALLVALIAVAYGSYEAFSSGGLPGAPWAKDLLQLSSGFTKAITVGMGDMTEQLNSDFNSLTLLEESSTAQLTKANKLLENNNWINPIVLFGEQPNDFYNRTIHSGNIGITAIGAISSYVDIALTLPKLNETLGEFNDA